MATGGASRPSVSNLVKVKYRDKMKFVKLQKDADGFSYQSFISDVLQKFSLAPGTQVEVTDDTGTEVDEDVFSDLLTDNPQLVLVVCEKTSADDNLPSQDYKNNLSADDSKDHLYRKQWGPEPKEITKGNQNVSVDYSYKKEHHKIDWESGLSTQNMSSVKTEKTQNRFSEVQQRQMQDLQTQLTEAKLALENLNTYRSQGKNVKDNTVQASLQQLQAALDLPIKHWIPNWMHLRDLTYHLSDQLQVMESLVLNPEKLPDEEILSSASGGLALQGLYKTCGPGGMLETRDRLLKTPDRFCLSDPVHKPRFDQHEAFSSEQETRFRKALENAAYSMKSTSLDPRVDAEYQSVKFSQEELNNQSSRTYTSITKYNCIPLASCQFEIDQLRLSDSALAALQEIEQNLDHAGASDRRKRIETFFERFGSHANRGPLHFGGIFFWKAHCEGHSANDLLDDKQLMDEILNKYIGEGFCGLQFNSLSQVAIKHIEFSVSQTGGPSGSNSYLPWKASIVSHSKTWSVIDRSLSLLPVWDIIMSNHSGCFKDASRICTALSEVYNHRATDVVESGPDDLTRYPKHEEGKSMSTETWENRNKPHCATRDQSVKKPLKTTIERPRNKLVSKTPQTQKDKCSELVCRLGLTRFYPSKMSTSDVLAISRSPLLKDKPLEEQDLSSAFLQKLLMLDYRARHVTVKQESSEGRSFQSGKAGKESDFSSFLNTGKRPSTDVTGQLVHIHPMDVQMALLYSADSFLRQYMVTKLCFCQYALPLLVPSPVTEDIEFPLWTFQQLQKSWKTVDSSGKVTSRTLPVYKVKVPMVSFFRLGSVSSSKSQILNSLISTQRHNTFFHRHCPGSSRSCLLLDGLVEIAWYCPAGRSDDVFQDCVAFCNLRGDAGDHRRQREFLVGAAAVNVVLLADRHLDDEGRNILEELFISPRPLICLLAEEDTPLTGVSGNKFKIGLKDRNQAEIVGELTGTIRNCFKRSHPTFSLESVARGCGFRVDEDSEDCKRGKDSALEVIQLLKKVDISKIKETFLPCQGKLWHDWCQKNKDLHRLHGNIEQTRSEILQEIKKIRKKQRDFGLSELMKMYLKKLKSHKMIPQMYFLKWLGVFIDAHCSDQLSELHHQYDAKWTEVLTLKKKHDKSEVLNRRQRELESLSKRLNEATFGLEHLLREMGQIYEAWESQPGETGKDVSSFPDLAADLLIAGNPVELMDGDAAHVPLRWIDSVLGTVVERLGDQRVFVLSVLGLQSSGKSTMLNAMFGLQFAVSAGRCTRGAFMQLVKVKEELREELKFNYVLVVDTEGLRALELAGKSTIHHDNELATFVIGLGNMTLINIFGENPAEMQDILQISVQAFLRMKQVRLSPSCMFVHQNVGEITAGEKNMEGKRRLQEKLDEMARLAAKEEVCDVECFNDVIRFDVKRDVHYFAQLWEGNPPMAPPNPRYSENIQELKQAILSTASQQKGLNLSEFRIRIQDLWKALLNENFVFSFKNTLEISAYRKLEVKYGNWSWKLRSHMLAIENKLHNRIENGQLETVDKHNLLQDTNEIHESIQKEMDQYFNDEDNEILVQWRARTELRIKELKDELIEGTRRKLDELIQLKKGCRKLDDQKTQYENKLFNRSKQLAHTLKHKASNEHDLKREFDLVWKKWASDITSAMPDIKDINIQEDVMKILTQMFESQLVYSNKYHGLYKKICYLSDYADYLIINKHKYTPGFMSYQLKSTDHDEIKRLVQDLDRKAEEYIKKKHMAKMGYSESYIQEILNDVLERIKAFESNTKKYVFKKEFKVDVSLFVCGIAVPKFTDLHRAFREANDPLTHLNSKKGDYYSIFRKFCQGATSTTVFADFLCSKLKPSLLQAVYDRTAIDVAGDMRANFPAFSGNRSNLEKHILRALAEEENFDQFITYIHHPKKYFKEFITQCVLKWSFTNNSTVIKLFEENLDQQQSCIAAAVSRATGDVMSRKGNVDTWLETFSNELKDNLKFSENDLKGVQYQDISDFDFLQKAMTDALQKVTEGLRNGFSLSSVDMGKFREKPDEILFRQLCGCWAQCPLCKAICTSTMEGHPGDHSVPFHRPEGVKGLKWYQTDNLSVDICTSAVASDHLIVLDDGQRRVPYKSYREAGPKYACWSITPDCSEQPYWKWFVCRFQEDLEKYYSRKFQGRGVIPQQWREITKQEALTSLEE
ncbi:interferon-induced very large GTPase 1-like isoform X1 [Lepisosteus oculatus]|uniref:interferon-induced very large GTPase 1-like isoform X1 n=1 Tax=Lepisosteus oculatus TaxID=7918 RepID=UPI0035F51510